ncbi:hypothetical protein [Nostoc sp.]|uniref:hypothetical protein n=1 Tax=Nostoc sp. TaxID=1180 RepID=UPI002FF63FF4
MVNENLKSLYDEVFIKIRPQIKEMNRGILYKSIQIILEEEQSETQEKTLEICNHLAIRPNAYRDEDEEILKDLVDAVFINRQVIIRNMPGQDLIKHISKTVNQTLSNSEENMKWIVVAACTLVGVLYCRQYLGKNKQQKAKFQQKIEKAKQQVVPLEPIPADLCLIVPASIASNLKNGSNLTIDELTNLIDNASYFLCTNVKTAESNEEKLETTEDYISSDSRREVYIKISIYDGQNLIGQKIPYYLKANLPKHTLYMIKQLAYLKNLSGLEKFIRI